MGYAIRTRRYRLMRVWVRLASSWCAFEQEIMHPGKSDVVLTALNLTDAADMWSGSASTKPRHRPQSTGTTSSAPNSVISGTHPFTMYQTPTRKCRSLSLPLHSPSRYPSTTDDHGADDSVENVAESVNVVAEPAMREVVAKLSAQLHAGWRALS